MNKNEVDEIASAQALFTLLSGRTRLLILRHLWDGEVSVGGIAAATGLREAAVSQQLALLRKECVVVARRDSQKIYYSIACDEVRRVLGAVGGIFSVTHDRP
ncbi:ArsR/SmtB family transcription factor [Sphingomonas xinjiangensis]|uniref:ArsR/SmtB family transcription factor n=1 Tax=Sphingomonas xinjiangensis TaxID=643568 RepID=UPI001609BEA0|nr:metalloregulator ArsR/SmtB family transcription factor [Sphingomonas xinjiangensis]